ncbi:membrane dipeptidase [Puteibacter caeruleilacunae]|nr:membrane dipeptidase [Puteibacter caeruleilacunae]
MRLLLYVSIALGLCACEKKNLSDEEILTLHNELITIDTHCDTPLNLLENFFDLGVEHPYEEGRVDIPRMKKGGLDGVFFAVFTGQKPRTEENYGQAYVWANEMIDSIYAGVGRYPEELQITRSTKDFYRVNKEGKRGVFIGLENGFPLAKDLSRVEEFYDRGVRYITLSHSFHNDICDSSSDLAEPEHNGLSSYGEQVVEEMNRLGMLIDISHTSDETFFDVVAYSKAPVFASHSSVRAIANHDRNMTDEMLKALAKKGGVIQICLMDSYVQNPDTTTMRYKIESRLRHIYRSRFNTMCKEEKSDFLTEWRQMKKDYPKKLAVIKQFVDHIDYVKNLVGVDYVGIGSDFDGGGALADCQDIGAYPDITKEMVRRGYSEKDIRKIWGENFLRVFKKVEDCADKK